MPTFITNNNIGLSAPIELTTDDAHHALHVLRLKTGETVHVTDNHGTVGTVKLTSTTPLSFDLLETRFLKPPRNLTVLLPLIDRDRLEWCIEKLAELNVSTVQLIATERTQKSTLNENQFKRLNVISETAQKQCGRAWPMTIKPTTPLKSICFTDNSQIFFGSTLPESIANANPLSALQNERPILICIGPEGGLTETETNHLKSHHAIPIHVGDTILRAETAAITLVSLILYR